jgi:hypothetical protein
MTSHEVSVKVVTLVSPRANLVGNGVRFLVEFTVNRRKTNHGSLSTFHHGHPSNAGPQDAGSGSRVDIRSNLGVSSTNQSHDNDNRKGHKEKRDADTDPVKRSVDAMGMGFGVLIVGHGDSVRSLEKVVKKVVQ